MFWHGDKIELVKNDKVQNQMKTLQDLPNYWEKTKSVSKQGLTNNSSLNKAHNTYIQTYHQAATAATTTNKHDTTKGRKKTTRTNRLDEQINKQKTTTTATATTRH